MQRRAACQLSLPPRDCVLQSLFERESGSPTNLIVEPAHVRNKRGRLIRGGRSSTKPYKIATTDAFCNEVDQRSDRDSLGRADIDWPFQGAIQQRGKCITNIGDVQKIPHLASM